MSISSPLAESARFSCRCATEPSRSSKAAASLTNDSMEVSSCKKGERIQRLVIVDEHDFLAGHAEAVFLAPQDVMIARRPYRVAAQIRFENHDVRSHFDIFAVGRLQFDIRYQASQARLRH